MRARVFASFLLLPVLLTAFQGTAIAAPANDDFADAIVIPSGGDLILGQAGGATRQAGEPNHAGISGAASVWFRWTPTEANLAGHVELVNFSDAIAVAVYTGSSVSALKEVGNSSNCTPNQAASGDNGAGPCVWFTASPNTTYRIAVVPSSDPSSGFSLSVGGPSCSVRGTGGNDVLEVTSAIDVVCGFGGNDVIFADGPVDGLDQDERQEDVILGGAGKDTLNYSGATSPVGVFVARGVTTMPALTADQREIFAEIGDVIGSPFADRLDGNANANTLIGGRGTDVLNGGPGADLLRGSNGVDRLAGNEGDDALYGGPSNDLLFPGAGDDVLWGGESGTDFVSYKGAPSGITLNLGTRSASGWGADVLNGIESAYGSAFADVLRGSTAQNMLSGGGGTDTLRTNDGLAGDTADGGSGTDSCTTDPGDVRISCP